MKRALETRDLEVSFRSLFGQTIGPTCTSTLEPMPVAGGVHHDAGAAESCAVLKRHRTVAGALPPSGASVYLSKHFVMAFRESRV